MRWAWGAAALATGLLTAASPAWAGDKVAVLQAVQAGAAILPPPPGLSLASVRRLEATVSATMAIVADTPSSATLRRGFGGSMTSLYPLASTGFHLSAGSRYSPRALAGKTVEPDSAALLWSPRGSGIRSTRRFSPAMLVGYDRPVADGVTLGLDGGVVMGRIDNARLGPHGNGRGSGLDRASGSNPVARMTLGCIF